jgi:hypothetical protein
MTGTFFIPSFVVAWISSVSFNQVNKDISIVSKVETGVELSCCLYDVSLGIE